jgi:beta-lactamase regulating signal transducer with metallopeptidase domain
MTAWIAESLVGSTLLMLVVLLLRGPVARAFGARWAYALWALPALRLVVPPMPSLFPEAPLPPVVLFIPTTERLTVPPAAESAASWEWMPFIVALWAGGAVIFLTLQWLAYRDFLRRLDRSARPARPPFYGGVKVLSSAEVEGPVALGLTERKIVVPADFLRRYSLHEQRLAMEHELIHHRRGDMWWNLAALLVLALNWFNPVAWLSFRAFRADQELACDAAVAAAASPDERHEYASALVKSATRPGLIAACPLTRAGQLKHRLRMMRSHRVTPLRSLGGGVAVLSAAGLCFAVGTPGFSHAPEREIIYLAAPAPQPASARGFAAVNPSVAGLAAVAAARKARPSARRAPIARAADPLALAAATTPQLPVAELPKLAAADFPALGQLKMRPRRVVRAVQVPAHSVRVFTAAVATDSVKDRHVRERIEIVDLLLARLREDNLTDADLQMLKAAVERLGGAIKVKVLHSIPGETEI